MTSCNEVCSETENPKKCSCHCRPFAAVILIILIVGIICWHVHRPHHHPPHPPGIPKIGTVCTVQFHMDALGCAGNLPVGSIGGEGISIRGKLIAITPEAVILKCSDDTRLWIPQSSILLIQYQRGSEGPMGAMPPPHPKPGVPPKGEPGEVPRSAPLEPVPPAE
jgi:hypothetical protein